MSNPINLDRQILAQFLPNHESIRAFELLQSNVNQELPSTIEEAASQAALATSFAETALGMALEALAALEQLQGAPIPQIEGIVAQLSNIESLLSAPRQEFGTISAQNAETVDITGGTIALDAGTVGTPSLRWNDDATTGFYRSAIETINVAIAGTKLLELSATLFDVIGRIRLSGQLTSTLATGIAPMVIASTTKVANLNADLLDDRDWANPAAIGTGIPASIQCTTFGANGSAAVGPQISGGTLAGVIAGLVAIGLFSS